MKKGVSEQLEFELIVAGCVPKVYGLIQGFFVKIHDLCKWASMLLGMQAQIYRSAEDGLSARNFSLAVAVRGAANGINMPVAQEI